MRIAIFGTGGVGGFFGGRLAAAGADVTFIARGAHLAALRARGLTILSPQGDLRLPRVNATDDPGTIGPVDLVLFAVKLYGTEAAIRQLPPLIGPQTLVVSLQNGVDSTDTLARAIGPAHVAGGTVYVSAMVAEPGVIKHTAMGSLVTGSLGARSPMLEQFVELCGRAGLSARLSDRIVSDVWTKFVGLSVLSGMTAVARCPIGVVRDDPALWAMTREALAESIAVARARQIPLGDRVYEEVLAATEGIPAEVKSSMLQDLERGRPLELPWLSGAVVRIGDAAGISTPTHRLIVTLLGPHVAGHAGA